MAGSGDKALAARIARRFPTTFLRQYAYWKIRTDPVYAAVRDVILNGRITNRTEQRMNLPLLDLGCGVGLLAYYLREHGFHAVIHGVDFDAEKIDAANLGRVPSDDSMTFERQDFRKAECAIPGHVTLLDVLQYLSASEQVALLQRASSWVEPDGGLLVIRTGVQDNSWRYRVTHCVDVLARTIRWIKSRPVEYPSRALIESVLGERGFRIEYRPLWGRTPFNNYLIVATR